MPQVIKNSNKFPILLSSIVIFDKYMLIYFFFSNIKKYEIIFIQNIIKLRKFISKIIHDS